MWQFFHIRTLYYINREHCQYSKYAALYRAVRTPGLKRANDMNEVGAMNVQRTHARRRCLRAAQRIAEAGASSSQQSACERIPCGAARTALMEQPETL